MTGWRCKGTARLSIRTRVDQGTVRSKGPETREAIREYWQTKVVQSQKNITCELCNLYLDGDTVIAEWLAEFDDLAKGERKRMREIAVLTFEGGLISSLREYWASEAVGLLERCN